MDQKSEVKNIVPKGVDYTVESSCSVNNGPVKMTMETSNSVAKFVVSQARKIKSETRKTFFSQVEKSTKNINLDLMADFLGIILLARHQLFIWMGFGNNVLQQMFKSELDKNTSFLIRRLFLRLECINFEQNTDEW